MIGRKKLDALGAPIQKSTHYRAVVGFVDRAVPHRVIREGETLPGSHWIVQACPTRFAPVGASPAELHGARVRRLHEGEPAPRTTRRQRVVGEDAVVCVTPFVVGNDHLARGDKIPAGSALAKQYPGNFRPVKT